MKRTFESLSPKEVLALAVHVERANAERFRAFADVFRGYDEQVAEKFEELAREEVEHEEMIVSRYRERFGESIPTIREEDVRGIIESVDLEDPEALIFDSLKPEQVYRLALRAERGAREFYRKAAAATEDAVLRAFYGELAEMERDHQAWLEDRLNRSGSQSQKG